MAALCDRENQSNLTAASVAEIVGGRLEGDPATPVTGISGLDGAGPGDVSFVSEKKYAATAAGSKAAVLVVPEQIELADGPAAVVRVADLSAALDRLTEAFTPPAPPPAPGVHPSAVVGENVELGEGVCVGPCAVIGDNVRIGNGSTVGAQVYVGYAAEIGRNTILHPQVVVGHRCRVGDNVTLHAGVVLGGDGFGYVFEDGAHRKVPQIGIVVVEDDVEVGCNTTIDRARFGTTRIGQGTKIDNQVMIAHNCQIGSHCVIVGQAGIAGSTAVGDYAVLGARTGVVGHVRIGDQSKVAAGAGVTKDVPAGAQVMGIPAQPYRDEQRLRASLRRLPELANTTRGLVQRVDHIVKVLDIEETPAND
jgi:UDP-3-O-[3-hydroxymyristoyl] glucosamine N-acyltransferase